MYSSVDTIWTLIGAVLVFFMQAGFAMVETGFTRAKNAGNIIMKNLMDFALGTIVFWILGFGLMFAGDGKLIGGLDILVSGDYSSTIPSYVFLIFQTVFCATAATIVSGAMAERTKFISYCIYSVILSAVVYPISGHWIWGGGWLSSLGFHDFAGSTAVHMVGGVAALIGATILGPRIGKYSKDGKPNAIPGHSLTLGALGVFILWFCWFGFNGGSTVCATGDDALVSMGTIFITTNLAAAVSTAAVMIITWIRYKKPDVSMTLNGSLAGLVAITAGCDVVTPTGAFFIGLIAAFVVVFGIEFVDKVLKVDDPVGAVGVHGFCGAVGTILTGLFAVNDGLFYGGGFHFLGVQIIGVVSVILWVSVTMTIVFNVINKTIGLRVSEEEEIAGLDIKEHGLTSSYADFMPSQSPIAFGKDLSNIKPNVYPKDEAKKMTMISIIINQDKLELLKAVLDNMGITGITVTQALGCGMQKGHTEYYRGVEYDTHLLPKVKVDIVVCAIPVQTVIDNIKKILCTGHIGDGKIFVYDVENVIKIRTGEEGYAALQDNA
ncbi:nitrogen regulatory protein P-II family /ammonium transporter [Clostridium sp. DSM 8431]|uniref:ammonium transporter n=1 Tax=Clostridium sp. DSM 8431 TaxID=1761781 RepID=UPI0008F1C5C9|nr:ammonium transporter [Clostridium sp. DSM 8431]SFU49343.1 nitrogen regulatory protein P-II family /ammonium transporter [Clostridium sp. DSM 8431]